MVSAASSNYTNSISSMYKYNYNTMRSTSSEFNTAGVKAAEKKGYVNDEAVKYLSNIKDGAKNMLESLGSLSNINTFTKMQAVSSNSESLEISSKSNISSDYKSAEVDIKQVATAQVNEGKELKSNESFGDSPGIRQFEIEQDGKKYQFSVSVKASDANQDVQQKMADAINSRSIGVTASVEKNAENGTSTLSIQSKNTGEDNKNAFTVRDVSGSLVSKTGADSPTQTAQNAIYSINGGAEQTSKTNNVDLGNGVQATLKKATTQAVTITSRVDTKSSTDAVKNMVDSFNSLLNTAKGSTNGNKLQNDLTNAFKTYAPSLERIGISAGKDGALAIDSDKLAKSAQDGSLNNFFTKLNSGNYGFTGRLEQIARNASANSVIKDSANTANSTQNTVNNYKQKMNNYDYVYNYMFGSGNVQGALFDLYA